MLYKAIVDKARYATKLELLFYSRPRKPSGDRSYDSLSRG